MEINQMIQKGALPTEIRNKKKRLCLSSSQKILSNKAKIQKIKN